MIARVMKAIAARACAVTVLAAGAGALLLAAPAVAAPGAHWALTSLSVPTYFHAGDSGDFYEIIALNDGGADTAGTTTLTDTLPAGVTATAIHGFAEQAGTIPGGRVGTLTCTPPPATGTITCTTPNSVPIGRMVGVKIDVEVPPTAAGTLVSPATIESAGAATASATNATLVKAPETPVPYGVSLVSDLVTTEGTPATQAGAHPFAFTTILAFNSAAVSTAETCGGSPGCAQPNADAKDVEVELPRGFVGNPTVVPKCTQAQFHGKGFSTCPADSQVGEMYLFFYGGGTATQAAPVYDVEPPAGQPAELGFSVSTLAHIPMYFHVRSDGDYGLTANIAEITQFDPVRTVVLSMWGVPANEAHTPLRAGLRAETTETCLTGGCPSGAVEKPFLTLPTSCPGQSLSMAVAGDSWQAPAASGLPQLAEATFAGMTGCESLLFQPAIEVEPALRTAGVPTEYRVHMEVPQNEAPEGLATPDVRDVQVTMPEGTALSPSAANDLAGCTEAQFGLAVRAPGNCPESSQVGTVKITTPLLPSTQPLAGYVYVGQPECAPCSAEDAADGKMTRLLLEAESDGVIIKLVGRTEIDQATGRLTTVFENNPQLPFDELELEIEGGQDAPLVNATTCGPVKAQATLTAWSALTNAAGEVTDPGSVANISSDPVSISGCTAQGFNPSLQSGMTKSAYGGSFSPFAVTISRADGQQALGAVTVHMPPGLAGMVSQVPLCGEADANAGTCPAASQIGTSTAVIGPGSQPYTVEGGKVFLTEKYGGGAFGLSIVVPAVAGPFHLAGQNGTGGEGNGNVVVRGSISIDPSTAAVSVHTNPIPTQLDGIPLSLDRVIVNIDREGFMFNPTDCNAMSVTGTIDSSTGTAADVSYPFQSVNCAALPFKPHLSAEIHAHHTRKQGEFLHVGVTSAVGEANIGRVHVALPGKLPSRMETLKLACTEQQFAANPAGCPAGSFVGHAVAYTPVLPVPMEGPAIFVSHGSAAFPNLDLVLQGDGVAITLVGDTFITKKSITTSTFKSVPDVPISRFDLVLPAGPHSALAGNGSMCSKPLYMPTRLTGQNGAVKTQRTKIKVQGCKPEMHVLGHRVKGLRARIRVSVPSAGRLIASGRGIKRSVKRANRAKTVSIEIALNAHDRQVLAKNPKERVNAKVKLRFVPKHGKPLSAQTKLLMG